MGKKGKGKNKKKASDTPSSTSTKDSLTAEAPAANPTDRGLPVEAAFAPANALTLEPEDHLKPSVAVDGSIDMSLDMDTVAVSSAAEIGDADKSSTLESSSEAVPLVSGAESDDSSGSRADYSTTDHNENVNSETSTRAANNASVSDDEWGEETSSPAAHDSTSAPAAEIDDWGEEVSGEAANLDNKPTSSQVHYDKAHEAASRSQVISDSAEARESPFQEVLIVEDDESTSDEEEAAVNDSTGKSNEDLVLADNSLTSSLPQEPLVVDALLRSPSDKSLQKESVQQSVPNSSDDWDYDDEDEDQETRNDKGEVKQALENNSTDDTNNDEEDDWGEEVPTVSNLEEFGSKVVKNGDEDEWGEEFSEPENNSVLADDPGRGTVTTDTTSPDATPTNSSAAIAVSKLELKSDSSRTLPPVQGPLGVDALLRNRADKSSQKESVQQSIPNSSDDDWDYDDEKDNDNQIDDETEEARNAAGPSKEVLEASNEGNSHTSGESDDGDNDDDDWGEEIASSSNFEDTGSKIVENGDDDEGDEWGEEVTTEPVNNSVLAQRRGHSNDWDNPADYSDGSEGEDTADAELLAITRTIQVEYLRRARLGDLDDVIDSSSSSSGHGTGSGNTNVESAVEDDFVDYIAPSADSVLQQDTTRPSTSREGGHMSTSSAASAYHNHRKNAVSEAYCALHHMSVSSLPSPTTPGVVRVLIGDGPLGLSLAVADGRLVISEVAPHGQGSDLGLEKGDFIVELSGRPIPAAVTDQDLAVVMSALPRPLLLGVLVPATTKSAYSWDDSALNTAEGEGEDDYFDEEMGFAGQVSDAASKNASAIAWNDAWDADEAGDAGYSGYDSSGGSGGTAAGAGATSNAYGYPPGSGGRLPPTPTSSLEAFLDSDIAKLVAHSTGCYELKDLADLRRCDLTPIAHILTPDQGRRVLAWSLAAWVREAFHAHLPSSATSATNDVRAASKIQDKSKRRLAIAAASARVRAATAEVALAVQSALACLQRLGVEGVEDVACLERHVLKALPLSEDQRKALEKAVTSTTARWTTRNKEQEKLEDEDDDDEGHSADHAHAISNANGRNSRATAAKDIFGSDSDDDDENDDDEEDNSTGKGESHHYGWLSDSFEKLSAVD